MFKARLSTTLTGQELLNLKKNNALTILPHQRLIKKHVLKDAQTLYEALQHGMSVPLQFSVLERVYENSKKLPKEFQNYENLEKEISRNCLYGIEDGQHRIDCFVSIFHEYDTNFTSEQKNNLLNAEFPVVYITDLDYPTLVKNFGFTNNAKPMSNPEKLWNIVSEFNLFFKNKTETREFLKILITNKLTKSAGLSRNIHKFITKTFKVILNDRSYKCSSDLSQQSMVNFLSDSKLLGVTSELFEIFQMEYEDLLCKSTLKDRALTHYVILISLHIKNFYNIDIKNSDILKYSYPDSLTHNPITKTTMKWSSKSPQEILSILKKIYNV
jgi:hypothetical protein